MKKLTFIFFLFITSIQCYAQNVYKTPSGARYHLSSCRMVENVSKKLSGVAEINAAKLTPCKICKPPSISQLKKGNSFTDKSVGTATSVRCKGTTQRGTRCKHYTKLANGYCFQHTKQENSSITTPKKSTVSICGARTKSGKPCRRKVKGGGFCYQHK